MRSKGLAKESLPKAITTAGNRIAFAEVVKGLFGVLQGLVSHPAGLVAIGLALAPLRFQVYKQVFPFINKTPREIYDMQGLEALGISFEEFERYLL